MRVLLFNPPGPEGRGYIREGRCEQRLSSYQYRMLPVSLPSIAGLLRAEGHQVRILDAVGPADALETYPAKLRAFDPELLVVAVSTPTFESDVAIIARVRGWTSAHITAIGVHVTATADETLRGSRLDSVVRGEPEWTVADLAAKLSRDEPLSGVKGISYRLGGDVQHNEDRGFDGDLDALPPPARDLVKEEDYFLPIMNRPYTLVVPSRGCPHHCTYCTAPMYDGKKLRLRTPSKVVDEIEEIAKRKVVNDFVMWTDTFTLDKRFVLEVCRELTARDLGVRWMCNSRVDSIDAEMATAMRRAGCTGIAFGIESGVQQILDNVRKGTTVAQGRTAVRITREAGIESLAHFILGLPGETPATIRETVAYARSIDPDWAQFYCATPLPGTPLRAETKARGELLPMWRYRDLELNVPSISTPALSARRLAQERARAYVEFYGRPRVAARVLGKVRPAGWTALARQSVSFARGWVLNA